MHDTYLCLAVRCASILRGHGYVVGMLDRGKGLAMLSEDEERPVPISALESSRKGGSTIRERYGEDYYRRIGKKGGTALKESRGSEYYREIAQRGGQANVSKYDANHFSDMGKKGGNATKSSQDPDFYSRIGKMGGAARRRKKASSGAE